MASIPQHCYESEILFGSDFREVHTWLDSYAKLFPPERHGTFHRHFRHNNDGIEYVRRKFGEIAARAAKFHIERDEGAFFFVPDREENFIV